MTGDLLLTNGRILTMDNSQPEVSAIAIRSGVVVACGNSDAVRAAAGSGVETIDLRGRTATPGLNDAHCHPMLVGFALEDLNLASPPLNDVADIVALVRDAAASRSHGRWIVGRGYDHTALADHRHPTRADLDPVSPEHPALLFRMCHHVGVANSRALALAGIDRHTADSDGGKIDRDQDGEPTGVVRETALTLVQRAMDDPTVGDLKEAIERAGQAYLAAGITSVAEAGIDRPEELRAYQELRQIGRLPVRVYLMMMLDENLDHMTRLGVSTGFGDPWLRIGPAKLFADGSLGGRTARLRQSYVGESTNVGLWMMPPRDLKAKVRRAHQAGFQVAIHAIGDAAIDLVLDAYEEAMTADPRPAPPRHRVEHCSITDQETIARIGRLGVVAVPGTTFLRYFKDAYVDALGPDRPRHAYGLASYLKHGVIAAASSDAPVVPISATEGLQTMVTRHDRQGRPVWPDEAVSLDAALRAYTVNGAYASFEENIKGRLAPGMLGDIAVWETDLRSVPADKLANVNVDLTIVGGNVLYKRE